MRILLIVNAHSRRGDTDLSAATAILERAGHAVTVERVPKSRFAADLIRSRAGDFDAIVLGGGDGTPHSAAPALVEAGLPVGLIPLGTCNDLAHSLGIPADMEGAAAVIAAGETAAIDVGEVNGTLFFNVAHIGFGSILHVKKKMKRRLGPLAYAVAAGGALRGFSRFRATIEWPGGSERLALFNITVGNGRFFGGTVMVSEAARIDDGLLHLFTLRTKSAPRLLAMVPFFLRGRQRLASGVTTRTSESFDIRTSRPMAIRADGKKIGETPAHFRLRHGALRFFVPGAAFRQSAE